MSVESFLPPDPGRGVAHHVSPEGEVGWLYFITGRSKSSRARRIRSSDGGLVVEPTEDGAEADELRHYRCVTTTEHGLVVGNGDHVDVIADGVDQGLSIGDAVASIDPEPDPLLTPRIALIVGEPSTMVAVRQSGSHVERVVMNLDAIPGTATMVVTYGGTVRNPMGSAPMRRFDDKRSLPGLAAAVWSALDPNLRVVLVAGKGRSTDPVATFP